MSQYRMKLIATVLVMCSVLAACNKAEETAPKADLVQVPAAVDAPAVPETPAAVVDATNAQPTTSPAASASTDVSVSGTEARAGDVSVKLPE
jgi:ABC-type uncharacterized transport system auxiliary subunit